MKTFSEVRKMYDGGRAAKRGWDCGDCGAEKNRSDQCRSCGSPARYHRKPVSEDLASGRPLKKPVSSNLLKQRAKENEKALASGFMKLTPRERAKESKRLGEATASEVLKKRYASDHPDDNPHNQKRIKDHLPGMKTYKLHPGAKATDGGEWSKKGKMKALKKQIKRRPEQYGVTESSGDNYNPEISDKRTKEKLKKAGLPPESPKVMEAKKPIVHFKGKDSLKMVKIKYNKPIKTKVTDIGPGGKEVVRKDWSEGIERDPKSNSFNRTKAKTSTVRVGQKRDKKTGKMVDVMGTSTAPQGFPSLKEEQKRVVESLGILVSRGMKKVQRMADDVAQKVDAYDKSTKGAMSKTYNPVSGKNIAKRIKQVKTSQKKRLT